MIPLLIVGGVAVAAYFAFTAKMGSGLGGISLGGVRNPPVVNPPPAGSTGAGGAQMGVQLGALAGGTALSLESAPGAALAGSAAVPIVGAAIAGVAMGIQAILAAHAKKVQLEASDLNVAVPDWSALIVQIINAYNAGEITEVQAMSYIDTAVGQYYQQVSGVPIKGRWPVPAAGDPPHAQPPSICNGPCVVGHFVEIDAFNAKNILRGMMGAQSGSQQSFTLTTLPPHAGFNGKTGETIIVQKP
jgi:hypothetical protein